VSRPLRAFLAMVAAVAVGLTALTALAVGAQPSHAATTGWLDRGYGGNGLATVGGRGTSLTVLDSSGRALVLAQAPSDSSYRPTRLTTTGTLDAGFAGAGVRTLPARDEGYVAVATGPGDTAVAVGTATAGGLVPLTAARILDTRIGLGAPAGPVAAAGQLTLQVAGRGGIPAADSAAVVLDVTVTAPTREGNVIVYPAGAARPSTSNLNFVAGQTVPNLVVVRVGTGGAVALFNASPGSVHVIADVAGYYRGGAASAPGTLAALDPARLLDTRIGVGAPRGAVAAQGAVTLAAAGHGGVPATGALAVVLNVTVTAPARAGYVTAYPSDRARPISSSVNFVAGQTIPNLVTVRLSASGQVTVANASAGAVHLIADVFGYYRGGTPTSPGTFVPVTPARVLGTRVDRNADGRVTPIPAHGFRDVLLVGRATLPASDVGAVVANLTATGGTVAGYLSVIPLDQVVFSSSSNVNYRVGGTSANQVAARVGYGSISVYNAGAGSGHAVIDLAGWFRA
jgi:hypothetical protein